MLCPTCKHDSALDQPHSPGQCAQCNCGEDEICHRSITEATISKEVGFGRYMYSDRAINLRDYRYDS